MKFSIAPIRSTIGILTAWRRKAFAIQTVANGNRLGSLSEEEFASRVRKVYGRCQADLRLCSRSTALWKLENLAATFFRGPDASTVLADGRLPREVLPISHSGMGVAAVVIGRFQAGAISRFIEAHSHRQYHLFACESVGAMLAAYEPGAFFQVVRAASRLGYFEMPELVAPPAHDFVSQLPFECRPLISHGFGRMLYFRNHSVPIAIRKALARAYLEFEPAVRGIAFAWSIVNAREIDLVLRLGEGLEPGKVRTAFEEGLVYALVFWDWLSPGSLDSFTLKADRRSPLIREAQNEARLAREAGRLQPSRLGCNSDKF